MRKIRKVAPCGFLFVVAENFIPDSSDEKIYTKNKTQYREIRVKSEKIQRNSFSFLFVLTFFEKRVIMNYNL